MVIVLVVSCISGHILLGKCDRLAGIVSARCRCTGNLASCVRCGMYDNRTLILALSKDDQTAPARVLGKFAADHEDFFNLKAGYVEGVAYDAAGVEKLSKIPSKEVLLAQLVGSLQGPIQKLAATLQAVVDSKSEDTAA